MLYVLCSHAIHLSSNDVVIDLDAVDRLIINVDIYFWGPSNSYHHHISTILHHTHNNPITNMQWVIESISTAIKLCLT